MLADGHHIYVKPDIPRSGLRYSYYRDLNGMFTVENTDNVNPYWQGDYATVHFTYVPNSNQPFTDKDVYLVGKLGDYRQNEQTRMMFNAEKGAYETTAKLKQGYYSYQYATVNNRTGEKRMMITEMEGNFWETENTYQVLVYYRSFGARTDELVSYTTMSSYNGRLNPGF